MQNIVVHVDDHSPEVLEALQNAVERGLMAIGEKAEAYAKDNITAQGAVDTGRLRNSITYALQGHDGNTLRYTAAMQKAGEEAKPEAVPISEPDSVYIGTAVFYGPYIEFGTIHQKARPFLKPAVAEHAQEYWDTLRESLKNA